MFGLPASQTFSARQRTAYSTPRTLLRKKEIKRAHYVYTTTLYLNVTLLLTTDRDIQTIISGQEGEETSN